MRIALRKPKKIQKNSSVHIIIVSLFQIFRGGKILGLAGTVAEQLRFPSTVLFGSCDRRM
jgi:hypothetical protein